MTETRDVRLPQRRIREITILLRNDSEPSLESFVGRWLVQHLDRTTAIRYSLAELSTGDFAVVAKDDRDGAVEVRVFRKAPNLRDMQVKFALSPKETP